MNKRKNERANEWTFKYIPGKYFLYMFGNTENMLDVFFCSGLGFWITFFFNWKKSLSLESFVSGQSKIFTYLPHVQTWSQWFKIARALIIVVYGIIINKSYWLKLWIDNTRFLWALPPILLSVTNFTSFMILFVVPLGTWYNLTQLCMPRLMHIIIYLLKHRVSTSNDNNLNYMKNKILILTCVFQVVIYLSMSECEQSSVIFFFIRKQPTSIVQGKIAWW